MVEGSWPREGWGKGEFHFLHLGFRLKGKEGKI